MSDQQPVNVNDRLRLGIEAARTGRENEARGHLIAVLKQDANNIPAMLWLAFVLPSPQDTIRLLKRVLALDPDNDRAKAGIRWARVRLGLPPEQPDSAASELQPGSDQTETTLADETQDEDTSEDSIRSLLLSEEVQQQAKKGALAHRARRTINPFLGIFLLTSAIGLLAIGLGALLFVPPETLAAWLPGTPYNSPVVGDIPAVTEINNASLAAEVLPQADLSAAANLSSQPSKAVLKNFHSDTDTVVIPRPSAYIYRQPAQTGSASPSAAVESPATNPAEPGQITIDPAQLIGPVGPLPPDTQGAVDRASLAYHPAYPGEKWIEVNVTTQQVTAWEDNVPVMSFTASTGLPNTPTVLGKFKIYWKLTSTSMAGPNYYLPEVPYTMYFYAGYALHGTYWHNNFGQPMSHGCVNLETSQAKQLFDWADPIVPSGQT
jgi:hypothetical protein